MAKKKPIVWFHGGPEINYLHEIRWDRDRMTSDQNAEGPGIYWTTDREEAERYGAHLYSGTMKPEFRLMPSTRPSLKFLMALYMSASADDRETFLSDWDENANPKDVLSRYVRQNSMLDAAVTLYHDLFHYNASAYVEAMQEHYDGAVVQRGTTGGSKRRQHLILWSPKKMEIVQEY